MILRKSECRSSLPSERRLDVGPVAASKSSHRRRLQHLVDQNSSRLSGVRQDKRHVIIARPCDGRLATPATCLMLLLLAVAICPASLASSLLGFPDVVGSSGPPLGEQHNELEPELEPEPEPEPERDIQLTPEPELDNKRGDEAKSLDEFLASLPVLSLGQRHVATVECELGPQDADASQLIWMKLRRYTGSGNATTRANDDLRLISLNERLIAPDAHRFQVRRASSVQWLLTIDGLTRDDDGAFFVCQTGARAGATSRLVGGVKISLLVSPQIIEETSSASLVVGDEYKRVTLKCQSLSEPQAQLTWKREDGAQLDPAAELRFRHERRRAPTGSPTASLDSAELTFGSFRRHQAATYLCIASNGVPPGVSRRISLTAANCRATADQTSAAEPCDRKSSEQPVDRKLEQLARGQSSSTVNGGAVGAGVQHRWQARRPAGANQRPAEQTSRQRNNNYRANNSSNNNNNSNDNNARQQLQQRNSDAPEVQFEATNSGAGSSLIARPLALAFELALVSGLLTQLGR